MTGNAALSGCRVLDLTDEKGMLCGKFLSDMGAEVILVEKPAGPQLASRGDAHFCYLNAGKSSISLDLEDEAGREIFKRLVSTADVLVESGPPGYLGSLGLEYKALSKINRRLVMASITGFGQNGPYRDYKVSDIAASALGGQMYVSGEADGPPLKPFGDQAYYSACLFAGTGVLLALWDRHTTGSGQYLDISIMECVAATLDHVLVRHFCEGEVAGRRGSLYWNSAFRVFPCRDGYVLLSLFHQWETLVEWLNAEGMAGDLTDKKWLDGEERLRQTDHIIGVLERWTRSHTAVELVEKGQLMRFPWAEVTSIPGLVRSSQLAERNFFVDTECPERGKKHRSAGPPCKLSRSPWHAGGRAPARGEDNEAIYRELRLSEPEMESLRRNGVI